MPASRSDRTPADFFFAACNSISLAASSFVPMSAIFSWIIWCFAIGTPNATRSCAYLMASSNARVARPTARGDVHAANLDPVHHVAEPLALLAEEVLRRHTVVLEDELGG